MAKLIPYLVFSGNCKEAMEFYANVFDGNITSMQTFAESPIEVSPECNGRIFDCSLEAGSIHFKASDDLPNHSVKGGNNFSLFVSFSDNQRKKEVFNKLSEGGQVLFPLDENFGMAKDRFGMQWMFVSEKR